MPEHGQALPPKPFETNVLLQYPVQVYGNSPQVNCTDSTKNMYENSGSLILAVMQFASLEVREKCFINPMFFVIRL